MDLTTHDNFVVVWSELNGNLTMTFKDNTEVTTLGTITVQTTRVRSFIDSLAEVALVFDPPVNEQLATREYCKTTFIEGKSRTAF